MDISLFVIFFIIAWILLIFSLMEERDDKKTKDEENRSDHLILMMLFLSSIFFIISGVCLMGTSQMYYSSITDTVEEIYNPIYRFAGFGIAIGFGSLSLLFFVIKIFSIFDSMIEGNET